MNITLYDYYRSTAAFRVRIALNVKGLDYKIIPVHLLDGAHRTAEYVKLNPQRLVPTLVIDDKTLTQSLSIIEYLNEVTPEPALLPQDPYAKSLVRSFALNIAADMHPLNNLRVLNYLTQELHADPTQKQQWYHHWLQQGFTGLEAIAKKYSGKFCFGDELTLADVCLVPQLYNARRFEFDMGSFPTLVRIDQTCQQIEAFKKAWPVEVTKA